MTVSKIHARYVYDSRGSPTVEVNLTTEKGTFRSIVPSGASTGSKEAIELRDGDKTKWEGKGVLKAVENVNSIIGPSLIKANLDVKDQKAVDDFISRLDGTENKEKLGANAILGVSMAVNRAGAAEKGVPLYKHIADLAETNQHPFVLPVPFFNVLNGGAHAGGTLAFQEFLIAPVGAKSVAEAVRLGSEVYHNLKSLAKRKYGPSAGNIGDEGGIAPGLDTAEQALDLIFDAIKVSGHENKVMIGMDAAASEFYKDGKYDLEFKKEKSDPSKWLTGEQLTELYHSLLKRYPIISLEDPFSEDDWGSWTDFRKTVKVQIIADDLTVTNPTWIAKAIKEKTADTLLVKLNQIGSLTESIQATHDAYAAGWGVQVSHRSGETEDTFIADFVVGLRAGQIKSGSLARSERTAKWNQLLRIEEELGDNAIYAGSDFHAAYNL